MSYVMSLMLQQVDEIYVNTIREFGLYDEIWQAFAVFLPIRSVGVQVGSVEEVPGRWGSWAVEQCERGQTGRSGRGEGEMRRRTSWLRAGW